MIVSSNSASASAAEAWNPDGIELSAYREAELIHLRYNSVGSEHTINAKGMVQQIREFTKKNRTKLEDQEFDDFEENFKYMKADKRELFLQDMAKYYPKFNAAFNNARELKKKILGSAAKTIPMPVAIQPDLAGCSMNSDRTVITCADGDFKLIRNVYDALTNWKFSPTEKKVTGSNKPK